VSGRKTGKEGGYQRGRSRPSRHTVEKKTPARSMQKETKRDKALQGGPTREVAGEKENPTTSGGP